MVLTSTHNLCFEQKYEKYQIFLSENFHFFLMVKFSVYLNRRVFVMIKASMHHMRLLYMSPTAYNMYNIGNTCLGNQLFCCK